MVDQELAERFFQSGALILAEMRSLRSDELDLPGDDGGWSPRFVVHHLADAEIVNARRLQRLLSEENVQLATFGPMALAEKLHYERDVEPSIRLFEAIHAANSDLIRSLDGSDWARSGTHVELGAYSVSVWLGRRIEHHMGHLDQIKATRR